MARSRNVNEPRQTQALLQPLLHSKPISLAAALLIWSAFPEHASSFETTGVVPLNRKVVEEMLVKTFSDKVRNLPDEDLAKILEQLMASDASTFPPELLKQPPAPSASYSARQPAAQITPVPKPLDDTPPTVPLSQPPPEVDSLVKQFQSQFGSSPGSTSATAVDDTSPPLVANYTEQLLSTLSPEDTIKIVLMAICAPTALIALYSFLAAKPAAEGETVDAQGLDNSGSGVQQQQAATQPQSSPSFVSQIWSFLTATPEPIAEGADGATNSNGVNTKAVSNGGPAARQSPSSGAAASGRPSLPYSNGGNAPNGRATAPPPPPFMPPPPPRTAVATGNGGVVWRRKDSAGTNNGKAAQQTAARLPYVNGRSGAAAQPMPPPLNTANGNVDLWRMPLTDLKQMSSSSAQIENDDSYSQQQQETEAKPDAAAPPVSEHRQQEDATLQHQHGNEPIDDEAQLEAVVVKLSLDPFSENEEVEDVAEDETDERTRPVSVVGGGVRSKKVDRLHSAMDNVENVAASFAADDSV